MQNCTVDFQPIIIAIAALLTAQVPLLVQLLINQAKIKHDVSVSKSLNYGLDRKQDIQTVILKNGFHGPKGDKGEPGRDGIDAADPAIPKD